MDWGEGEVLAVRRARRDVCDACGNVLHRGLVIDVSLHSWDRGATPTTASLCEACFGYLTSDLGVELRPGSEFGVLIDPADIGLAV